MHLSKKYSLFSEIPQFFWFFFYQVFFRVGCKVGAYDELWYTSFSKIFQQSFVLDKTKKSL